MPVHSRALPRWEGESGLLRALRESRAEPRTGGAMHSRAAPAASRRSTRRAARPADCPRAPGGRKPVCRSNGAGADARPAAGDDASAALQLVRKQVAGTLECITHPSSPRARPRHRPPGRHPPRPSSPATPGMSLWSAAAAAPGSGAATSHQVHRQPSPPLKWSRKRLSRGLLNDPQQWERAFTNDGTHRLGGRGDSRRAGAAAGAGSE